MIPPVPPDLQTSSDDLRRVRVERMRAEGLLPPASPPDPSPEERARSLNLATALVIAVPILWGLWRCLREWLAQR